MPEFTSCLQNAHGFLQFSQVSRAGQWCLTHSVQAWLLLRTLLDACCLLKRLSEGLTSRTSPLFSTPCFQGTIFEAWRGPCKGSGMLGLSA